MRRILPLAFVAGLSLLFVQPAAAQVALPKSQVNTAQPVFCVDPSTGAAASCAGSVSATTTAKATAANPSYTEGTTTNPLSVDLTGFLRVRDDTLATLVAAAVPAGTNIIGKVGIDQTTPGTTNGVQVNAALPAGTNTLGATYSFQNGSGNVLPPAADSSAAINVSTATTTQIVALASSKKIYVSAFDVIAGGTGNITFVYGTGSNCGTGTTSLTGAYNLTAQAGISKGNGLGAVLVVPASNALCVTTSAAVQMSGSVAYSQF